MVAAVALSGCVASKVPPPTAEVRPLDSFPSGPNAALARSDVLSTARARFGEEALAQALASPGYLVVKRFAGFVAPPPDAGPEWRAPTPSALLMRTNAGWSAATADGWRSLSAAASAELDGMLADPAFAREPAYTPACPDFGASLAVVKRPGARESIRNAQCSGRAASLVEAALTA